MGPSKHLPAMTEVRDDPLNCLVSYVPNSDEDVPTAKLLRVLVEFASTERGRTNICRENLSFRSATGESDPAMPQELAKL